ncbi:unnamed protein product, partial [Rotaria sordida]
MAAEDDVRAADLIGKALDEVGDDKFSNIFYYPVLLCFNIHKKKIRSTIPFHLQETFTYRREKIGVRDECLKLVPAENIQENTVEIIKQQTK